MSKKMKTYTILPTAALTLAVLLTSCDNDVMFDTANGGDLPMKIQASVEGSTKASMQTTDLKEFYLQVKFPEDYYSFSGKVSKTSSAWNTVKPLFWQNDTTTVSYCAAYFGNHVFTDQEFADGVNLTLPSLQISQAQLNSADLLTLSTTQTKYSDTDNGVLPVTLSHALSKVNLIITLGDAFYDEGFDVSQLYFRVSGGNLGFNFKPQTGEITVIDSTKDYIHPFKMSYTPGSATDKVATIKYEVILVPQTLAAGQFEVTSFLQPYIFDWTNASAITFESGKTYNIPISFILPPYDPYKGHEYVDMGLSVKWATCNVGAKKPSDHGDYFAWGDTETKSDYSYNKYSYKYINNKLVDNSLPLECDAANRWWGGSWRMPTKEECDELHDENNCTWVWTTTIDNQNGYLVTSKINGNSIFLPAAGYRSGTDLIDVGSAGGFWSSSLDMENPSYAWGVGFSLMDVIVGSSHLEIGRSVRPVTN